MSRLRETDPHSRPPGPDPLGCDQEPIHSPAAIQPHGALLAALADGLLVTHASANLAAILGRPAESVLGRPLETVIGETACSLLPAESTCHGRALGPMQPLIGPAHLPRHRAGSPRSSAETARHIGAVGAREPHARGHTQ